MKFAISIILTFLTSIWSCAQEKVGPLAQSKVDEAPAQIEVDPHRWDDQVLDPGNKDLVNHITFNGNAWIQADKSSITVTFSVDKKEYEEALKHPELNRGVILIAGNLEKPDIYCWLRPFMINGARAIFVVTVPRKDLKKMYCAFIPRNGKQRFVYNLASVVERYGKREGQQ